MSFHIYAYKSKCAYIPIQCIYAFIFKIYRFLAYITLMFYFLCIFLFCIKFIHTHALTLTCMHTRTHI